MSNAGTPDGSTSRTDRAVQLDDEVTVYVTNRGGRYVKAEELLRSRKARRIIADMAKMFPSLPAENPSHRDERRKP